MAPSRLHKFIFAGGYFPGVKTPSSNVEFPSPGILAGRRLGQCRESRGEGALQGEIDLGHSGEDALVGERGDAVLADAAGDDPLVMAEVGIDVQGHAMEAHPMAHAHADGGDLALAAVAAGDPDADATRAPFAAQMELRQRADEPFLEAVDEGPDVAAAALEVEHDIAHALPRPVIGVLPAATAAEHR